MRNASRSLARSLCALAAAAILQSTAATKTAFADPVDDYIQKEAVRALVDMGKAYYETYCATCHGLAAHGGGPAAKALKVPPPDLTKIGARRDGVFDLDELSQMIDGRTGPAAHGSREMPIWGSVFAGETGGGEIGDEIARGRIVALLEYLRGLQRD